MAIPEVETINHVCWSGPGSLPASVVDKFQKDLKPGDSLFVRARVWDANTTRSVYESYSFDQTIFKENDVMLKYIVTSLLDEAIQDFLSKHKKVVSFRITPLSSEMDFAMVLLSDK